MSDARRIGKSGEYRPSLVETANLIMKGRASELSVFEDWKSAWGGNEYPAAQICFQASEWGKCALPMIELSHTLGASLAATSVAREVASGLLPPWPTFSILCPTGSVCKDELFIIVTRDRGFWCFLVATDFISLGNLQELGEKIEDNENEFHCSDLLPHQSEDIAQRLIIVAQRITIGVILESINSGLGVHGSKPQLASKVKRGDPVSNVFKLARPVYIDVRDQIRNYVETGRTPVSVQTLVRGHYKMQPHGDGRAQRKYIHVEPYWRGPEDAPIVVRPHRMTGGVR